MGCGKGWGPAALPSQRPRSALLSRASLSHTYARSVIARAPLCELHRRACSERAPSSCTLHLRAHSIVAHPPSSRTFPSSRVLCLCTRFVVARTPPLCMLSCKLHHRARSVSMDAASRALQHLARSVFARTPSSCTLLHHTHLRPRIRQPVAGWALHGDPCPLPGHGLRPPSHCRPGSGAAPASEG